LGASDLIGEGYKLVIGARHTAAAAETLLAFGRLMDAADLPTFQKLRNVKKSDIYVAFAKRIRFNKPYYVTVYCKLIKSNQSDAGIT